MVVRLYAFVWARQQLTLIVELSFPENHIRTVACLSIAYKYRIQAGFVAYY